jgi:hypothetical protein
VLPRTAKTLADSYYLRLRFRALLLGNLEDVMATQTMPRLTVKEPQQVKTQPELIATPFGNLTRAEVREWEKMLGRKLLRLPKEI